MYERYVDKIYNYVYYRVGNQYDAEDLTAKVFFRALNHIPHYKHRGSPLVAWLYRIAHNLVANWHRDRKRHPTVTLENLTLTGDDRQSNPQRAAEQANEREVLLEALQTLPYERQQLLTMKFAQGMSNAEIGKIMGRSEGAIKSLYYRTLISLKKALADHGNLVNDALEEALEVE